ncbi:MAG TPA: sulfite exporter TauE/SafE family protein [Acidimicrobiales bacterium]|nr:sulfite exporter TauE/SafE family protein [Acidimicrobiales bacterium]
MGLLILVTVAGLVASLVDGALGMGFGPTSSTLLLGAGLAPAAVSTTVNVAKVASGLAGGMAHYRFGNVDRGLVVRLAVPGSLGALVGVTVLANVDGGALRPYLAGLLLLVGLRMLLRFSRPPATGGPAVSSRPAGPSGPSVPDDVYHPGILVAAFLGGVTNGLVGAWGPVVTPVLLGRPGLEPRVAIGSVNTAEVAVALTASGTLIASLNGAGVDLGILVAMLLGGVTAAPVAAWVVRHLAPRWLGVGAGGLLLLTSTRDLAGAADLGLSRWAAYAAVATLVAVAARVSLRGGPVQEDARPALLPGG